MFEFLGYVLQGIGGALRLNPRVFEVVENYPNTNWIILVIAVLGGASMLVGQSVILFVNRVRPGRFVLSLVVNGIIFATSLLIWAIAIWVTGQVLFPNDVPFRTVIRLVGLGATPYLFGFLVLIPYLGTFIGRVLSVWSFLVVLAGITFLANGALWPALVCVGLGYLLVTVGSATIGRPILAVRNWLFKTAAGTTFDLALDDVLDRFANEKSPPKGGR